MVPKTIVVFITLAVLVGCQDPAQDDLNNYRVFEFEVTADKTRMRAKASSEELIRSLEVELAVPFEQRSHHVNGAIARGTNGNMGWSWHYVPDEWSLAEVSMELCDGVPSDIDGNPSYWIDTVGTFCPWSARLLKEVPY